MYAALHIPEFAIAVCRHGDPQLAGRPLALVVQEVVAGCSREAAAAGVVAGLRAARALARCPALVVVEREVPAELRAGRALVEFGRSLAADVEATAPGTVIVDAFAVAACRRDPAGWRAQAAARAASLAGAPGSPLVAIPHVALAPTPDLAQLAASAAADQWDPEVALAWPLAALAPLGASGELLDRWHAWGLRTLGALAALDPAALAARQGGEAAHWQRVLSGREHRRLRLEREPVEFASALELEDPIESLEPLVFLLNRLLGILENRLAAVQRVAASLDLDLRFADGGEHHKNLRVAEPTRHSAALLAILRTYLETLSAPAPLVAVALRADPCLPGSAQPDLLRRGLREANRFYETLGRIEGLVGQGRVGTPLPADSHAPDQFSLLPFGSRASTPPASCPPQPVPLRRFRPPRPVRVACLDGIPQALLTSEFAGHIDARRGPFLLSGHWWEPSANWRRAEWDIQSGGRLLRLARLPVNHWQLEGIYG